MSLHLKTTVGTYDVSTISPDGMLVRMYETCIFTDVGLRESDVVAHYSTEVEARYGHANICRTIAFVTGEDS